MRPPRPGNGLLAAALVINGAWAAAIAMRPFVEAWMLPRVPHALRVIETSAHALNLASLVPLALLPFVVPWPRVGRRARIAIVAIALGLWVAVLVQRLVIDVTEANAGVMVLGQTEASWVFRYDLLLIHGSAIAGTLVLLDSTLSARGPLERRLAATLLAAFVLRVTTIGITTIGPPTVWPLRQREGSGLLSLSEPARSIDLFFLEGTYLALWCAALAVPAALIVNRMRGGVGTGSVTSDVIVVAMLPLGIAFGWMTGLQDVEYLVLRPIILAYALLQFQMLGVDVRRGEAIIGGGVLAGLLAVFLLVDRVATSRVGDASTGLALVATLGVAGALALPLLRLLLHPAETDAPRRLLVYRAALEAAQRESDPSAAATLRALRRELGVSDKEHALLAGQAGGPAARSALAPGDVLLDRYRIVRPLGRGASGEVVLAKDERLQRDVAIKQLAGHVRRDALAVRGFEREMRMASALHHPNIVAVHDVETIGDDAFLIMEYMPGGSLQERIDRDGALPEAAARDVTLGVLAALGALHARGIIHRDVKPSNVLLDATGRAKLADFTVARDAVSGETVGGASERPAGTWAYMSPEQARGLRATPKSDLYSVGATLYATLAARPPVDLRNEDEHGARMRIAREEAQLPLAGVSAPTNAVLARALAKSPSERFASADEMASALA